MLLLFKKYFFRIQLLWSAERLQLFCKPLASALACGGLQMCCNVRGLLIGVIPNAPKRRNARWVKKLKPLAEGFPKSLIRSVFLFVVILFQ